MAIGGDRAIEGHLLRENSPFYLRGRMAFQHCAEGVFSSSNFICVFLLNNFSKAKIDDCLENDIATKIQKLYLQRPVLLLTFMVTKKWMFMLGNFEAGQRKDQDLVWLRKRSGQSPSDITNVGWTRQPKTFVILLSRNLATKCCRRSIKCYQTNNSLFMLHFF